MFELEGKLSWKRPSGFCRGPSQHSEKKRELMMNPGVDGYIKTLNQRKIPRETQKGEMAWI